MAKSLAKTLIYVGAALVFTAAYWFVSLGTDNPHVSSLLAICLIIGVWIFGASCYGLYLGAVDLLKALAYLFVACKQRINQRHTLRIGRVDSGHELIGEILPPER